MSLCLLAFSLIQKSGHSFSSASCNLQAAPSNLEAVACNLQATLQTANGSERHLSFSKKAESPKMKVLKRQRFSFTGRLEESSFILKKAESPKDESLKVCQRFLFAGRLGE